VHSKLLYGGTAIVLAGLLAVSGAGVANAATKPSIFKNCTALNKRYPHGVGRSGAHDKTSSGRRPVTTWTRNTAVYKKAIKANVALDRDHDGIACEKR
jgi:hypothetical protein